MAGRIGCGKCWVPPACGKVRVANHVWPADRVGFPEALWILQQTTDCSRKREDCVLIEIGAFQVRDSDSISEDVIAADGWGSDSGCPPVAVFTGLYVAQEDEITARRDLVRLPRIAVARAAKAVERDV